MNTQDKEKSKREQAMQIVRSLFTRQLGPDLNAITRDVQYLGMDTQKVIRGYSYGVWMELKRAMGPDVSTDDYSLSARRVGIICETEMDKHVDYDACPPRQGSTTGAPWYVGNASGETLTGVLTPRVSQRPDVVVKGKPLDAMQVQTHMPWCVDRDRFEGIMSFRDSLNDPSAQELFFPSYMVDEVERIGTSVVNSRFTVCDESPRMYGFFSSQNGGILRAIMRAAEERPVSQADLSFWRQCNADEYKFDLQDHDEWLSRTLANETDLLRTKGRKAAEEISAAGAYFKALTTGKSDYLVILDRATDGLVRILAEMASTPEDWERVRKHMDLNHPEYINAQVALAKKFKGIARHSGIPVSRLVVIAKMILAGGQYNAGKGPLAGALMDLPYIGDKQFYRGKDGTKKPRILEDLEHIFRNVAQHDDEVMTTSLKLANEYRRKMHSEYPEIDRLATLEGAEWLQIWDATGETPVEQRFGGDFQRKPFKEQKYVQNPVRLGYDTNPQGEVVEFSDQIKGVKYTEQSNTYACYDQLVKEGTQACANNRQRDDADMGQDCVLEMYEDHGVPTQLNHDAQVCPIQYGSTVSAMWTRRMMDKYPLAGLTVESRVMK